MVHTSSHATEQAVRELLHTDRVRTVHLGSVPVPAAPVPAAFVAVTEKVYAVFAVRPVTVAVVPLTVAVPPPVTV